MIAAYLCVSCMLFVIARLRHSAYGRVEQVGSQRMVRNYPGHSKLAAHLTIRRLEAPIKSAADLSQQTTIKYGTLKAGATRKVFKNSNLTVFKRMNAYMEANAYSILVDSNKDGLERVVKSNYAFLAESTSTDYQIQRICGLMQIGSDLDTKGYGIAALKGHLQEVVGRLGGKSVQDRRRRRRRRKRCTRSSVRMYPIA